jgi:hypothetical protein
MKSDITKELFNEFSNLVNLDLETQIRRNENSLRHFEDDYYDILGKEYLGNIENMMVRFYSSVSNMVNIQNGVELTATDNYNSGKLKETLEKIITAYKPKETVKD